MCPVESHDSHLISDPIQITFEKQLNDIKLRNDKENEIIQPNLSSKEYTFKSFSRFIHICLCDCMFDKYQSVYCTMYQQLSKLHAPTAVVAASDTAELPPDPRSPRLRAALTRYS